MIFLICGERAHVGVLLVGYWIELRLSVRVWQVLLPSEPSCQPKTLMIFCDGPLAVRKSPFNVPYICVNWHSLGGTCLGGPMFPVGSVPLTQYLTGLAWSEVTD